MIDARGRSCPEPVIMLMQAMRSGEPAYEMTVDDRVAVENVTRYAQHAGYAVAAEEAQGEFILRMTRP